MRNLFCLLLAACTFDSQGDDGPLPRDQWPALSDDTGSVDGDDGDSGKAEDTDSDSGDEDETGGDTGDSDTDAPSEGVWSIRSKIIAPCNYASIFGNIVADQRYISVYVFFVIS